MKNNLIKFISIFLLFLMLFSPLAFAAELKLVKVSDLKEGDVIVDKDGNEIKVDSLATKEKYFPTIGQILNNLVYGDSQNNLNIYTGSGSNGNGINLISGKATNSYGSEFTISGKTYSGGSILYEGGKFNYYDSSGTLVGTGGSSLSDPISSVYIPLESWEESGFASQEAYDAWLAKGSPDQSASALGSLSDKAPPKIDYKFSTGQEAYLNGKKVTVTGQEADGKYLVMSESGETTLVTASQLGTTAPNPNANDALGKGPFGVDFKPWYGAGYLVQSVYWASVAAGIVGVLGGVFSDNPAESKAITSALAAGILVGRGVWGGVFARGGLVDSASGNTFSNSKWGSVLGSGWTQVAVGAATAWITYNSMWEKKDIKNETVSFSCLPWQAPHGGTDCELCNDENLPCSEYRCKSLGQSCDIINKGTTAERCVNMNPRDVAPPVLSPYEEVLSDGLKYTDAKSNPPGAGFKIKSSDSTTGCIKPYTSVTFGIQTNEPAQCKIDYEHKDNYSQMRTYFGGDNLYSYNHTETLALPSSEDFKNSSLQLQNGKELSFFIRCRDAQGNTNEADYEVNLCVDPSPDNTAPQITATSLTSGSCVAADQQNSTVSFYVNEPAECRWSFTDQSFENMQNNMSCAQSVYEINALQTYPCTTTLTGIAQDGTDFYVRCKDQPLSVNDSKRNTNFESYKFSLKGSNPLKMKNLQPNETIYGVVNPMPVELYAETLFGCENNKAVCFYSTTGDQGSFVQFFDTNKEDGINTQRLDLTSGTYSYTVKCVDAGGNVATNTTTFTVNIDANAPIISRVYEEDSYLKLVSPKNAQCAFTNENCDFLFQEGTPFTTASGGGITHVTPWLSGETYYIKCKDEFRTEPTDCSLVVRPTDNFL